MPDRQEVYRVLDGEQEYCLRKWATTEALDNHEIAAWILYMEHHLENARKIASTVAGERPALEEIRKVTNLGVRCMSQHGAPERIA